MFKALEETYEFAPVPVRLGLAAVFAFTGITKLMDPATTAKYFGAMGFPSPEVFVWLAIIIELVGALFLLLGFLTRLTAIGLSAFLLVAMTMAYFLAWPPQNMLSFMFHWPVLGGALSLIFSGPGRWSLDGKFFWE